MNATVAVIGAGNIGTRHLQAILKCSEVERIFAMEPSAQAVEKARQALGEEQGRVTFCSETAQLPPALDVVIVAVNSMVRRQIVEQLLAAVHVRYLILEKVLFPRVEDYEAVRQLLERTGTSAWVNCVRRSWPYTRRLQELFANSERVSMQVSGNLWGIGCNTIHYVDWLCAITKSDLVPVFDYSRLDNEILESKRSGYVEFTGELSATLGAHTLRLISWQGVFDGFHITLEDSTKLCTLREVGDRGVNIIRDRATGAEQTEEYECPYQSNLTNRVLSTLLSKNVCPLVGYEQSARQHIPMIQTFLKKLGTKSDVCNIT